MNTLNDLKSISQRISNRQRLQVLILMALMVVGALAELISLGAVVPFIAVLSNPKAAMENTVVEGLVQTLDLDSSEIGVAVSVMFAVMVTISSLIRLILLWATNKVVFGISHSLSVQVFATTLNRPYDWHLTKNSSEILAGLSKVQAVTHGYLQPLLNGMTALVMTFGMFIMLIIIDPFVALVGSGTFIIFYFITALSVRRKVGRSGALIAEADHKRLQEMQEGIGNIRDIILESSQKVYVDRFALVDERMRNAQSSNNFFLASPRVIIEGIGLVIISVFAMSASGSTGLTHLLPTLAALGLGAQKLIPLVQAMYGGWNAVVANRRSLQDVLSLLDTQISHVNVAPLSFTDSISLSKVSYHYPNAPRKPALSEISINIKKGSVVGIVGRTGSGKSTLVDLLMGLIPVTAGDFYVDQTLLNTQNKLRGWSFGVTHVPQSIFLADCSVAENIALGIELCLIDYNRLKCVAKAAELHEFIESLPDQYNTEVGERGVRLSGGQRQRIGIARALYRPAKLLVLDEATSALDDDTERRVIDNIQKFDPELTIIMVAHRLSTLAKCDFIICLEDGRLSKTVSYSELTKS